MASTREMLIELGAVRPMAPESHEVLALGEFGSGCYPILWERHRAYSPERWLLFGVPCDPLNREDCLRVLERSK